MRLENELAVSSGSLELSKPFFIGSRLLASVRIGNAVVSLGYSQRAFSLENRIRYAYFIDLDNGEQFSADDIQSGAPVHGLKRGIAAGFASLFSCLGAWHEALEYSDGLGRESDNLGLFPTGGALEEWARLSGGEFSMLREELEPQEHCECGHSGTCEACNCVVPIKEHGAP